VAGLQHLERLLEPHGGGLKAGQAGWFSQLDDSPNSGIVRRLLNCRVCDRQTNMDITSFDDLLAAARQQADPPRLLFTFAVAELPPGADAAQRSAFARGEGGTLAPVACVDKTLDELCTFTAFAEEADRFAPGWVIVFAASLAGRAGQPPGAAEADAPLERMVAMVKAGDIGSLLPLNRQGVAVRLG
jgi:hypothetical protein